MYFQVLKFIHAIGTDISFLLINALLSSFSLLLPICSHRLLPPSTAPSCSPLLLPLLLTSPAHISIFLLTPPAHLSCSARLFTMPAHLSPSAVSSCSSLYFCSPPKFFSPVLHSSPLLIYFPFFPALLSFFPTPLFPTFDSLLLQYILAFLSTTLLKRKFMLGPVMPLALFLTGNITRFP